VDYGPKGRCIQGVIAPFQFGGGESLNHLMWNLWNQHIRQGAQRRKRKRRAANSIFGVS
jgi:hypothetical protein